MNGEFAKGWPGVSEPLPGATLVLLSLGGGVQSTVLALMGDRGLIAGRKPDAAIIADPGAEGQALYDHVAWLETQLSYPVYRVSSGNIADDILAKAETGKTRFASIPYFIKAANGTQGMGMRQCTREYRVDPIHKKTRELLGLKPRQRAPKVPTVEQWIGISTDEMQRMKDSGNAFVVNRWPLIEMGFDRDRCLEWFAGEYPGRPLAKSACVFCPFQTNDQWKKTRENPESWALALNVDKQIRENGAHLQLDGTPYLHRQMVPLDEVEFDRVTDQISLFDNDCDGVCGV
jgi:hypothetical protein